MNTIISKNKPLALLTKLRLLFSLLPLMFVVAGCETDQTRVPAPPVHQPFPRQLNRINPSRCSCEKVTR